MNFDTLLCNKTENRLRAGWRVLLQFIFFFCAIYYLPSYIEMLFSNEFFLEFSLEIFFALVSVITVFAAFIILDRRVIPRLKDIFNSNSIKLFLSGFLFGTLIFTIHFVVDLIFGNLVITGYFFNESGESFIPAMVIRFAGYFCVAVTEELFSRGYQLKNFAEGFYTNESGENRPLFYALVLSSFIFGMMHIDNPSADLISTFNLFLIGLFFGYIYIITGSLAMPVGLHLAWNFVQGNIYGYPVSGFKPFVAFFSTEYAGNVNLINAEFGPESGVYLIPLMVIAAVVIKITRSNTESAKMRILYYSAGKKF